MDERVVVASIIDQQQHTLCRVIDAYVPAQTNARQDFLCTFLSLPFIVEVDYGPWLLLGDFNVNVHNQSNTRSRSTMIKPWYEWVKTHFDDYLPQGLQTFTRDDTRTTIDYIFGHLANWSHRWLLDLPLQELLRQNPGDTHHYPLRYLLSDIVKWNQHTRSFLLHQHRLPKLLSQLVNSIWNPELGAPHHLPVITPLDDISITGNAFLAPPWQRTPEIATSLLPSLSHGTIAVSTHTTCQVSRLSLTQLRHIWHPSWQHMLNRPRPPERPKPSCLMYPPSFWKNFWKLPIPHPARTPWWRLLLDTVSTRSKLHRLHPDKHPSRECLICKAADEDLFHMFVDCPYKRLFWMDALQLLNLTDILPNQRTIWHVLVTLRTSDNRAIDPAILCRLGCIVAVLWKYHWRCVIEDEFWFTATALGLLTSNVLFPSFIPNPSVSQL